MVQGWTLGHKAPGLADAWDIQTQPLLNEHIRAGDLFRQPLTYSHLLHTAPSSLHSASDILLPYTSLFEHSTLKAQLRNQLRHPQATPTYNRHSKISSPHIRCLNHNELPICQREHRIQKLSSIELRQLQMSQTWDYIAKIVSLGDSGAGKSSVCLTLFILPNYIFVLLFYCSPVL